MFLEVLKVIGIVIAALIVFIIALVIFILVSPIWYKGKITYKNDKADVTIKVNHIFRLVYGYLYYKDENLRYYLRVLWEKVDDKDDNGPLFEDLLKDETLRLTKPAEAENVSSEEKSGNKRKRGLSKKISLIYNDIKRKIRYYYDNIREIFAQINDKENREAFVYAVKMIKIPVKYLVQNKLKVKMKLGEEDPAKTGEYVGLMYALAAILGFTLELEPDFDNKVFELDAQFKGHVSVYKVLVWVLELYSNDKLKIVIDDIL